MKGLSTNAVAKKRGMFYLLDAEKKWTPVTAYLYYANFRAYKDPSSFTTEVMKLSYRKIS